MQGGYFHDLLAGDLFDLGDYPAAVSLGKCDHMIPGYVITIDAEEFRELDQFENVHLGEYRRVEVITLSGCQVFAYEFALDLPKQAKKIQRWPE